MTQSGHNDRVAPICFQTDLGSIGNKNPDKAIALAKEIGAKAKST
jgi:hypothetical protein